MNCLCINIRGMCVVGKDEWVSSLKKEHDVGFLSMQETKINGLEKNVLGRFWGGGSFDYEVVDPTGLSGSVLVGYGMLCERIGDQE